MRNFFRGTVEVNRSAILNFTERFMMGQRNYSVTIERGTWPFCQHVVVIHYARGWRKTRWLAQCEFRTDATRWIEEFRWSAATPRPYDRELADAIRARQARRFTARAKKFIARGVGSVRSAISAGGG